MANAATSFADLVRRTYRQLARRMAEQENMARWDRFVLIIVLSSAVEVPYSAMVTDGEIGIFLKASSWLFFIVYSADIAVSLTIRENGDIGRSKAIRALWLRLPNGWLSRWRNKIPKPAKVYLASWSFVIDLVATIPWVLLSSSLGVLPAARLARLAVIARAFKLWKAPSMWRGAFRANPALGRFVVIIGSGVYLWFLHACILFWAERSNPDTTIAFADSLNSIFVTFTSNDMAQTFTPAGRWVSISAVVFSVTVVAAVFGNFTSFFTNRDQLELAHRERHADWNLIFGLYPTAFTSDVCNAVRQYLDDQRGSDHRRKEHLGMIYGLRGDLETLVTEAIVTAEPPVAAVDLERLKRLQDDISRGKSPD